MIPTYILNWNWLTPVKNLVSYLVQIPEVLPIIVDNGSTYPPLLEWYKNCHLPIVSFPENVGSYTAFDLLPKERGYFIVTDADLDISQVPLDVVDVLKEGLLRFPNHVRAGLSIEVSDVPVDSICSGNMEYENSLWNHKLDDFFYEAGVDTTFALYRGNQKYYPTQPSIRSDRPYTAKHLPWYLTSSSDLSEEEKYYYGQKSVVTNANAGMYTRIIRKFMMKCL